VPILSLSPHPDGRSPVTRIEVETAREAPGLLRLTFHLFGVLDRVAIPQAEPPSRTDGLWKHTCFEVFLGAGNGYYEFNLSPSSQWAAYRFDSYRAGMRDAAMPDPLIAWCGEDGTGKLSATLQLPMDVTGPLGLSVVIEDIDGSRAYWALAHPAGQPDFHHAACFAAELPSAG
jgi:hypothetical protein